MTNIEKYQSLLQGEVDGLLLTSRFSRHYAARFDIAEGVAIITKAGCRYFTVSRYIESAQNGIKGFEVIEMNAKNPYNDLLNKAIADFGVKTLGYEEGYLTVAEFLDYEENLNAKLVPMHKEIAGFRAVKEDWELDLMRKAQEITDKAFADVLPRIKVGMTELELQAELIYCLYKNGGQGLSFDPIVVSGPNTSLPHGVACERVIQEGDFITMDFGALYQGYCADMTRTVAVGYATEEMKKVYEIVKAANEAGRAAIKPGLPMKVFDRAARKVIEDVCKADARVMAEPAPFVRTWDLNDSAVNIKVALNEHIDGVANNSVDCAVSLKLFHSSVNLLCEVSVVLRNSSSVIFNSVLCL